MSCLKTTQMSWNSPTGQRPLLVLLVVMFHRLKLFGFFVILERVRRVGCPTSRQVALFPDDRYEINTPFFLGNIFLDNGKAHIVKVKLTNIHSKNPFCLKFNAFSYNFSDEFIGVLKRLNKLNKQRSDFDFQEHWIFVEFLWNFFLFVPKY